MPSSVYILYSPTLDAFYTGFTGNTVINRLEMHNIKYYENKFTGKASDWELYLSIECTSEKQARAIESHIKKMKSKTFILNLKRYPEIIQKLLSRYSAI